MTKQELLDFLKEYEEEHGKLPTRDSIREKGLEYQFSKEFGSFSEAKFYYLAKKDDQNFEKKKLDSKDVLLEKLKNQLSEFEIKTILESSRFQEVEKKKFHVALDKESFKFIAIGDTHIGHKKFREDWWDYMIDKGIEEEVDWMYHTGDIVDGMSNRPGHIYELSELGFEAQFGKVKSLFKEVPFQIKAITGNHDCYYMGKADQGVDIGQRLEESLDNFSYMGIQECDEYVGGIKIKLWHGLDGSQYAHCHDDETEILTEDGWKLFKDLNKTERVATLNPINHEFQWQLPNDYIDSHYEGKMYHYKSRTLNLKVTPNHRMYVRRYPADFINKRKKELKYPTKSHGLVDLNWSFIEAKDCFEGGHKQTWQAIKNCEHWEGERRDFIEIPYRESKNKGVKVKHLGTLKVEDVAELMGWYVTEGHIRGKGDITIAQYETVNPQYVKQIFELFRRIGLSPRYGSPSKKKDVRVGSMELSEYLLSECGHLSRHKFLPKWLKNQTKEVLRIVFETMIAGDGWKTTNGFGYRSISKRLLEDFAEIAIKLGYGVTFSKNNESVSVNSIQIKPTLGKTESVDYVGRIYCVSVDNGIIFTRRNGRTMWGGNSYRTQKFIEALSSNDKPDILLAGHAHKSIYHTVRNVAAFETGTLCEQTMFMRGKKLQAHTGFWIITVDTDGESIIRLKPEWFPLFK